MTGDVDVYDEHAEALMRFATALVGSDRAVGIVSTAVRRTRAHRQLTDLKHPRMFLLRRVFCEARRVTHRTQFVMSPDQRSDHLLRSGAVRGDDGHYHGPSNTVRELPLSHRAAVYLVYVLGLDSIGAARVLRVPASLVRRYLNRAGKRCRSTSSAATWWFRRDFRDALAPVVAQTPRVVRFGALGGNDIRERRSRRRPGRIATVVGAAVGAAVAVGVVGILSTRSNDPIATAPVFGPSVNTTRQDDVLIVAADPGPTPSSLAPCCPERPFGVGYAVRRVDVTLALRNQLTEALDQIDLPGVDFSDAVLWPAAAIRDDLYTVVALGDAPVGVIKTTGADFDGFGASSALWVDTVIRKNWGWTKTTRVVWSGVPSSTAVVRVTMPDGANLLQQTMGQTVFFDLAIPGWSQLATFTALDVDGRPLATKQLRLDGGGCSGRRAQIPFADRTLPEAVGAVRLAMLDAAIRCDAASVEEIIASWPGTVASLNGVPRSDGLAELDLSYPIMWDIGRAFKEQWAVERSARGDVYVWSLESRDAVIELRVPAAP